MTVASLDSPAPPERRASLWAGYALTGLFVAFMVFDLTIKLMRLPIVAETLVQLGWPSTAGFALGVLEAVLLVLYVVPQTAVLGAVLITGLLGGAVATHARLGDPLFSHVLFGVYLGLFAWGGLWLREPRLRAFFPLRF